MNVASLDLCRELYELSGWVDDEAGVYPDDNADSIPKYSLGYLLRKLPYDGHIAKTGLRYMASCNGRVVNADTPEDAACKLAIELIRQNIIKVNKE